MAITTRETSLRNVYRDAERREAAMYYVSGEDAAAATFYATGATLYRDVATLYAAVATLYVPFMSYSN